MKYRKFDDYLQEQHDKQYLGLDDEGPDDYEEWLSNLSVDEWIELGNTYAFSKSMQLADEILGSTKKQ